MAVSVTEAQGVVWAFFLQGDGWEWFGGFRGDIWVNPEVAPPRICACRAG